MLVKIRAWRRPEPDAVSRVRDVVRRLVEFWQPLVQAEPGLHLVLRGVGKFLYPWFTMLILDVAQHKDCYIVLTWLLAILTGLRLLAIPLAALYEEGYSASKT